MFSSGDADGGGGDGERGEGGGGAWFSGLLCAVLVFAGAGAGDNPTACTLEVLGFPASVDVLLFVIVLFGFRESIDPVIEACVSQSQAIKKRQHVRPENRNSPQYITLTF